MAVLRCLVVLLTVVTGSYCGDWCDTSTWDRTYCSNGCCGLSYDEYCCPEEEVANVAGIVIGCIVGMLAIVSLLVCICCCVRRSQRMPGQILTPGGQNTTVISTTTRYPVNTPTSPGVYGQPQAQQTAGMYGQSFVHQTGYTHGQNYNFASAPPADPATFQPPPSYEEVTGQKQELN